MTEQMNPFVEDQQKKGRLIMLAIVAVFVLPFFIAPLLQSPAQLNKTNKGVLIQPHIPLADLQLHTEQAGLFDTRQLSGRWNLLYVIPEICDEVCVQARDHALYAMRQVRLSLDRDVDHVQQLLVFTRPANEALQQLINKEFSSMQLLEGNRIILETALISKTADVSPAGNVYLMSPDGYVFMAYPTFADEGESILRARDIRADLKKSIKGDRAF